MNAFIIAEKNPDKNANKKWFFYTLFKISFHDLGEIQETNINHI